MHIKNEVIHSYIIQKSEFICYLNRCDSVKDYKEYLNKIKKNHYDATHFCSAYIIDNAKHSSDDGEPSGTAGKPILNVLEKNDLQNTCAIVVRYFGGIKLGAGGLTRAYSNSVVEALDSATKTIDIAQYVYQVDAPYSNSDKTLSFLEKNTKLISKDYCEKITYTFGLNDKKDLNKIIEFFKGVEPIYIREEIIEVDI